MNQYTRLWIALILVGIFILGTMVIVVGVRTISVAETFRVGVIVKPTNPAIAFWQVVKEGVLAAGKDQEIEIIIDGPFDEIEVEGQIQIMDRMIEEGFPVIILAGTDYHALAPSVEKAFRRGIKVITFDSDVNSPYKESFIATNNVEAGRKAAQAMISLLGSQEPLVILSHVRGTTTAIERERGVRTVFEEMGSNAIKGTYFCDNFFEKAYSITANIVTEYPWIRGIIALNEVSTVGAIAALRDLGKGGQVHLVGFDHSLEEIKALEDGVLQATVVQKPFNMGYIAVQKAKELLKGKRIEPYIDTGSVLITKENLYLPENQKILFPFSKRTEEKIQPTP